MRFATAGPLTVFVAMTACVHPSAVARYAESASRTTDQFPTLAREIHSSCLRVEAYRAQRTLEWYDETSFRRACARRDTAVAGVIQASNVLSAYLKALGSISAGGRTEDDIKAGQFIRLLGDKAGFNASQLDASERLATFVSSKAVSGFRRRELSRVIGSYNGDVQVVTGALLRILMQDYPMAYEVELRAQDNFYRTSLAQYGEREPLAAILVREQRDRRALELRSRQEAVKSYASALRRIQTGHQKLYDERNHLDAPALTVDLIRAARELDSITRDLERAFR